MDIYKGEILAMHSSPSYNPNLIHVFGISKDEWQLVRNNPLKPLDKQNNYQASIHQVLHIKPIVALVSFREQNN